MTNFEQMPDAEITRWAAERDGWMVECLKGDRTPYRWLVRQPERMGVALYKCGHFTEEDAWKTIAGLSKYATSADATLALAERWFCRLESLLLIERAVRKISIPTELPREFLNILCAAKEAEERQDV